MPIKLKILFVFILFAGNVFSQTTQNVKSIFEKVDFKIGAERDQFFEIENENIHVFIDNGDKLELNHEGFLLSHSDNASVLSNFQLFKFDFDKNTISVLGEIPDKTANNYKVVYSNGNIVIHPSFYSDSEENLEIYTYSLEKNTLDTLIIPNHFFDIITKVELLYDGKIFIESQVMGSSGNYQSVILEKKDDEYKIIASHESGEVNNTDFRNHLNKLLEAINKRDLEELLSMVSPDFYFKRDFGGMWESDLSYKENFIRVFSLDNSKLRPEYYDSGWYQLKILILTSNFDETKMINKELCSDEKIIEMEDFTHSEKRICFELLGDGEFKFSGFIGGGD